MSLPQNVITVVNAVLPLSPLTCQPALQAMQCWILSIGPIGDLSSWWQSAPDSLTQQQCGVLLTFRNIVVSNLLNTHTHTHTWTIIQ